MKKRILAGILSAATVLTLTGLTGCKENGGAGDSGDVTLKDDGDKLTILAWANNADIKNMKTLFCKETGVAEDKVEIVPCGDQGGDAREKYMQYLTGDGDADIMCLEADWILQYINDDSLTAPLSSIGISESNFASPYSYTVAIGKNEKGVLKGASFQAAPGGFVYRADLAKEHLGVNSPEEMQAKIGTWEGFEATAKELKDKAGIALQATEGGLWQVYQANRTSPWVKDNKLVMDNAEKFYDIAKTYTDNGYMTTATQWNEAWYAAVTSGSALGEFLSTWGMVDSSAGQLFQFANNKEGDEAQMAFCMGPQNYFWGGTWLGVSTKCNNTTLAKQFVEFFTCKDDTMRKYVDATGDFCNNSKVMKAIVDEGTHKNKYLVGGQSQFPSLYEAAPNIKMDGLITKYDSRIKELFNTSVQDYVSGKFESKDAAIADFKKKVAADYQELTVE